MTHYSRDHMQRQISLTLVASLLAGGGCYDYAAVRPEATAPGQIMRVDLSPVGTSRLASLVGPYAARMEGVVQAADDSTLTLSVREVVRQNGVPETWSGERVRLASGDMNVAERRAFSRARTAAVSVLALGAATIAAVASHGSSGTILVGPVSPPTGK
jgi:hypothetical protein